MPRFHLCANVPIWGVFAAASLIIAGCGPTNPPGTSSAVTVNPGASWTKTALNTFLVPGQCVAAWNGPSGSSLVVVKSLPTPRGTAAGLGMELTTRLDHMPGLKIIKSDTATIAGREAARVDIVAPGFGDSLAPSGLGKPVSPKGREIVSTHRTSVGFPLPDATYWVVCHYPESEGAKLAPEVESILKGGFTIVDRPAVKSY